MFQGPEVQYLQRTLARARVAATPPPGDVPRVKEAQDDCTVCSRKSLRGLLPVPESATSNTNDIGVEVAILKAKLAKTEAERDALRAPPPRSKVRRTKDAGGCSGQVIPFMPTLVSEELDDWMKETGKRIFRRPSSSGRPIEF